MHPSDVSRREYGLFTPSIDADMHGANNSAGYGVEMPVVGREVVSYMRLAHDRQLGLRYCR